MLKVDNLFYAYPGSRKNVIEDLSFEVKAGEAMVFVGPNGTGKSTVLSMLAGVNRPAKGKCGR